MHLIKKSIIVAVAIIYAAAMNGCGNNHSENHHEEHDQEHEEKEHGHNEDEIVIEPEDAAKFGIVVESVAPETFHDVINVTGQIIGSSANQAIVTATTAGIITLKKNFIIGEQIGANSTIGTISAKNISGGDPNQMARVAIANAKRQLDRLEPLLKEGIITQREYDAALAEYQSAQAAYSPTGSSGKVVSPIAGIVSQILVGSGQYVEIGTPIAVIVKNSDLVLRADLPEKYRDKLNTISTAIMRPSYSEHWISIDSLSGKRTTAVAGDAIAKAGYIPVYFTIKNNGTLSNGTYVDVCLKCQGSTPAITLPTDAIVEQQGAYFAYVKTGDHSYEKRKIELGETAGDRRRVISGIEAGDQVVMKGAIVVKLAESSGAVPEGHSHNH